MRFVADDIDAKKWQKLRHFCLNLLMITGCLSYVYRTIASADQPYAKRVRSSSVAANNERQEGTLFIRVLGTSCAARQYIVNKNNNAISGKPPAQKRDSLEYVKGRLTIDWLLFNALQQAYDTNDRQEGTLFTAVMGAFLAIVHIPTVLPTGITISIYRLGNRAGNQPIELRQIRTVVS